MMKLKYIPIILILFFGAVMIGITDYITAGFEFSSLLNPDFLNNMITTNGGVLCIIISILLIKTDKFITTDPTYLKIVGDINSFYNTQYKAPIFNRYTRELTIEEYKKPTYLRKMQKKYNKLKPSISDQYVFNQGTEEEKRNNNYCQREARLSYLMSDEYMKENIHKIRVKHKVINSKLIFSGVQSSSKKEEYITTNKLWKIVRDLAPKFLLSLVMTAMITALAFDFKEGINASLIIKTSSKIFTISTQISFALNYSDKYNKEVSLADAQFRYGKLTGYDLWLAKLTKKGDEE